jgi:Fur family peroxide stress response transcriptional regulator
MEKARRFSRKRAAIIEALRASDAHPSAEMLYRSLKEQFPDLSLGTVYRNLSQLRQDGDIVSVATVAGQERYDANTEAHTHFICNHCHSVIDLWDVQCPQSCAAEAARRHELTIQSQELILRGVCTACSTSRKS